MTDQQLPATPAEVPAVPPRCASGRRVGMAACGSGNHRQGKLVRLKARFPLAPRPDSPTEAIKGARGRQRPIRGS